MVYQLMGNCLICLFGVMVSVVMLIDLSTVAIKVPRELGKYSVQ